MAEAIVPDASGAVDVRNVRTAPTADLAGTRR